MPPVSVLIKPASGLCNMRCHYCFYADETRNRHTALHGVMSPQTMENLIRETLAYAEDRCEFGFQGGEPTLAGLDYFRAFTRMCDQHNVNRVSIGFSLQTNGLAIDKEWTRFFRDHRFLVGLSLDGPAHINDLNRLDSQGNSTFRRVMTVAKLLRQEAVDFNVLTVVTRQAARHIHQIYHFFMDNGLVYQQYIPCLDPLGQPQGRLPYSLTPQLYGRFLCELFDLWLRDRQQGRFVYIRFFENIVGILQGHSPDSCDMCGRCISQYVTEADGSVYPCDFYMLDAFRLGNFNQHTFKELAVSPVGQAFIRQSLEKDPQCLACPFLSVCRGGCRRHRQQNPAASLEQNYFCSAYRTFFPYALPRLTHYLGNHAIRSK